MRYDKWSPGVLLIFSSRLCVPSARIMAVYWRRQSERGPSKSGSLHFVRNMCPDAHIYYWHAGRAADDCPGAHQLPAVPHQLLPESRRRDGSAASLEAGVSTSVARPLPWPTAGEPLIKNWLSGTVSKKESCFDLAPGRAQED